MITTAFFKVFFCESQYFVQICIIPGVLGEGNKKRCEEFDALQLLVLNGLAKFHQVAIFGKN